MTAKPEQDRAENSRTKTGAHSPMLVFRAKIAIFWEHLAPVTLLSGAPLFTIIIISLLDGWRFFPQWGHLLALIGAFTAAGAIAWKRRGKIFWPSRRQALMRLETDGRVRHDALRATEDESFSGAGDNPLWRAHLDASAKRAKTARLGGVRDTIAAVDPQGLRFSALALLLVAIISAGGQFGPRLLSGLMPSDPRASAPGFVDLWIEPPEYTGKPPIYLLGATDRLDGARQQITAPAGSKVIAQTGASSRFRLNFKTVQGVQNAESDDPANRTRAELTLASGEGVLKMRAGGRAAHWPVNVIADKPPGAGFTSEPAADDQNRLAFSVAMQDDYGIANASLRLRLVGDQPRPLDATEFDDASRGQSRLITLDGAAGASGERGFAIDLQADPWAGLEVTGVVVATDAAGQIGETEPVRFTLPERSFFNPLARAVIEQRQSLAIAPGEWRRVEWAFSGLTLGPQYFFDKPTDYLLLRTAMWRVNKKADGDHSETVTDFWPLALQLEDEALELARRQLEAAKEALREALERGADDEEIGRLTENLRNAMQQYLQALAQSGQQMAGNGPPPDETLDSADLDAMLDAIRDLAQSGAQNAARQALSDLERLLDNLRLSGQQGGGQQNAQGGQGEGESGGAAGQAGDLIGRQRDLANRSFERGQTYGATGGDLAQEQDGIAGDVSDLIQSLGEEGAGAGANIDPEGRASRSLGQAMTEMRRSEEALGENDFDAANDAMERAIAALREGGEELARNAGQQGRDANGEGQGMSVLRDPLGREMGQAYGDGVEVPEISDAQRARELLMELRRRLSNGERTQEEIDYLERLLERF